MYWCGQAANLSHGEEQDILRWADSLIVARQYHRATHFGSLKDYFVGVKLQDTVKAKSIDKGQELYINLAKGLDYIQLKLLVHLDVKPENNFVSLDYPMRINEHSNQTSPNTENAAKVNNENINKATSTEEEIFRYVKKVLLFFKRI